MPGEVVPVTGAARMLYLSQALKLMFLLPACTYCIIAFSHVCNDR